MHGSSRRLQALGGGISALAPGIFFKFWGQGWGPNGRPVLHTYMRGISKDWGSFQRAPAKPQQKLWDLVNVLVPQMLYPLLHSKANKGVLKRMFIRTALHLLHDTPLGYFHASGVDGGLGVVAFGVRIQHLKTHLIARLLESEDPAVREVAREQHLLEPTSTPVGGKREERGLWSGSLYGSVDGRGLREATLSPISAASQDRVGPNEGW